MHKYFAGFTSEHDCRNTMTPMRRHCDEIATFSAGGLNDCSVGMFMLEVRHSTRDPHDARRIGNCFEDLCGVLPPCASCTKAPCPRSSGSVVRVWNRNRQNGDLCADLFGQSVLTRGDDGEFELPITELWMALTLPS